MLPQAKRLNDVKEYYFSTKLREVRSLIDQGKPIINLDEGQPFEENDERAFFTELNDA